jgi:DNA-binding HxlR family transcriptional regulator
MLTQRLRALERNALVVARPYSERPPLHERLRFLLHRETNEADIRHVLMFSQSE